MKRLLVALLLLCTLSAVSAINEMNVVVFPDVPSTTFTYNFVFASTSACDVLLNSTASITTNLAGRGNATLDTSSLVVVPAYLCTYRDGVLVNTQSLNRNAFESFATSTAFSSIGNWTADKPSYALITYVNSAGNYSAVQSGLFTNISNLQNSNATAFIAINAQNNAIISLGNWTADKTSYSTTVQSATSYQARFNAGVANQVLVWTNSTNATAYLVNTTMLNTSTVGVAGQMLSLTSALGLSWTDNYFTNISLLQTYQTNSYTNITSLQTGVFTNFTQIQSLVANVSGIYTNLSSLQTGAFTNFTQIQSLVANVTGIYANVTSLQSGAFTNFSQIQTLVANVSGIYTNLSNLQGGVFINESNLQNSNASAFVAINALNNSVISIGNYSRDAAGLFTNITNLQLFQNNSAKSIFSGNISANDSMFVDNILQLNATTDPASLGNLPPQGSLDVYVKNISGRMMFKAMGPSGNDYPYQPSFFQNLVMFIGTGGAAVINVVGTTVTSVGTVTNVASTSLGFMVNQVTAALANNTAGTGSNVAMVSRVTGTSSAADGWFFNARVAYPDAASMNNIRAFVGLTSGTMAASVSSDNPAGQGIGFMHSTTGLGANWMFMSDDNVLIQRQDTGINFSVNAVYDMYEYCGHGCTDVYWRIDDLTYNQTASGSISAHLPTSGTLMRFGHQIDNVDATARNVRMQRIYLEMDR